MTTLLDYISESILSSTRTGKAGLEDEMRRYGLDPAKVTFNADGTIDYDGTVKMNNRGLTKLPFKFRNVSGSFYCQNNDMTTLEGAPDKVGGVFDCSHNSLTSLNHCPKIIKSTFDCCYNQLTSLEGGPEQVGYDYDCSYNKLTSFEGLPKKLNKMLYCFSNTNNYTKEDVLKVCKVDRNKIYI